MSVSPYVDNDKKPVTGEFIDSTPLLGNPEALRQRAEEDGLLFFKQLIPKEDVLKVRRDILRLIEGWGFIREGTTLDEALADIALVNQIPDDSFRPDVGIPFDLYRDIQKLESFHAFAHHPQLHDMLRTLFGSEPFAHPRNIARVTLPHRNLKVTPSHQDFLHVQGHADTWTTWIPLGDVPRKLGGLAVLKGSHKAGLLGVTEAPGAGGLETILCGFDYEWQSTEYEAGDVLTFNSLTVHKAQDNHIPGAIRMSCDFRYQATSDEISLEQGSLLPHGPYTWEELYEGWERKDLQYYWQNKQFNLVPYDKSIRWQKEKIC